MQKPKTCFARPDIFDPDEYIKFLWHPFLLEIPQWLDKLELPTEKWISRRQLKTAITFAKIKYSCCVLSIKQRYLPVELFVINFKYWLVFFLYLNWFGIFYFTLINPLFLVRICMYLSILCTTFSTEVLIVYHNKRAYIDTRNNTKVLLNVLYVRTKSSGNI